MRSAVRVHFGLGSNIEPEKHLRMAVVELQQAFGSIELSPCYESAAVGFAGDPFHNRVAAVHTDWTVADIQAWIREVEARYGRDRNMIGVGPRTLDIDLLTYGDVCGWVDGVALPRAELRDQAYVLRPLAELTPNGVDPLTGNTFAELWERSAATAMNMRWIEGAIRLS
jgi:2-amino-4-hydroxy-6-hydroxymethyldihydropteridine diphosphokinase